MGTKGAEKTVVVQTADDVRRLLERLEASAERVRANLRVRLGHDEASLSLLAHLKFRSAECDPLDPDRRLNFVEQLNQTLTYQATFEAAAWLLEKHPECAPLVLNLGTSPGTDIASQDGQLLAEVFASVDPRNNRKLQEDIERLRRRNAAFKYVLYLSPTTGGKPEEFESDGVRVRRIRAS